MEKDLKLSRTFFRFHYWPFVAVTILFLIVFPFLFGAQYLEPEQTAMIVERLFTIIGIVLFIPLYLPDRQKKILAVVRAKKTSYSRLLILRLVQILAMVLISLAVFLLVLKLNRSEFNFLEFFFAEFATVLFLGGLLNISYTFFQNLIPSTMVAMMYYVLNMFSGSKYFGPFYLYTLMENDWQSKIWLFLAGVVLLTVSIILSTQQKNNV